MYTVSPSARNALQAFSLIRERLWVSSFFLRSPWREKKEIYFEDGGSKWHETPGLQPVYTASHLTKQQLFFLLIIYPLPYPQFSSYFSYFSFFECVAILVAIFPADSTYKSLSPS